MARRGAEEFRLLYPWLMTDGSFKQREKDVQGYLDGAFTLSATKVKTSAAAPVDPVASAKRDARGKVAMQYKYCPITIDEAKQNFRSPLKSSTHRERVAS